MEPFRGAWLPDDRVIFLDRALGRADRNSVLAHEIAHIDLEHESTGRPWFDRRQERQADRLAARRLIDVERLAEALKWCLCEEELADHLDVTVDVVRLRLAMLRDSEKAQIDTLVWGKSA